VALLCHDAFIHHDCAVGLKPNDAKQKSHPLFSFADVCSTDAVAVEHS
jgi:hypothetical protein